MLKRKHQRMTLLYTLVILLCVAILWARADYPMLFPQLVQLQERLRLLIP